MSELKKFIAVVWVFVPAMFLSALIHAIDPDIGGIQGLASPSTLLSVVVWGLPVGILALMCLFVAVRKDFRLALVAVALVAIFLATLLVVLQTNQDTMLGRTWSLVGGSLMVFLFLVVAVFPAVLIGWKKGKV